MKKKKLKEFARISENKMIRNLTGFQPKFGAKAWYYDIKTNDLALLK